MTRSHVLQTGKPHASGARSGWLQGTTPRSQPGAEAVAGGPHGQETHSLRLA